MDVNKRLKLVEVGYEIGPSCGTCKHGRFEYEERFGTCEVNEYQHLKHTGKPRKLSVYEFGRCPKFERAGWVEHAIHGFKEFMR